MPAHTWPALGALALAVAAVGLQPPLPSDPATRDICATVNHVDLPAGDRPGPAERTALAGCVSVDLYFGLGVAADPVRARKCAYLETEAGELEPVFGGRTLLMMAYANGRGVARNFDVALALACAIGGAPQDVAGRVQHLARLRAAGWAGDSFSVCDHSSGPALYARCAALQERFDQADRTRRLAAVTRRWTPAQRRAFDAVRQAADRFFRAHAGRESDLRATQEVQERAALEEGLLAALERFEQGDLPRHTAGDLRDADAEMRARYADTQRGPTRAWGTVTADAVKDTQQLWLAYRDAWIAFAASRYPSVASAGWQTWLARERTGMLAKFPQSGG